MAARPDDEQVIASSGDGAATIWEVTTREAVRTMDPLRYSGSASLLAVTDGGDRVALGRFFEDRIVVRDVATGSLIYQVRFDTGTIAADWRGRSAALRRHRRRD